MQTRDDFDETRDIEDYLWDTFSNNFTRTPSSLSYLTLIVVALFPMIWGGVHLAARNFHFPSTAESTLWEVASIGIIVFIPFCGIAWFLFLKLEDLFPMNDVSLPLLVVAVVLLLMFYALARTYIVVEAFISLREAPLGVYVTLNWLQSIPHF